MKIKVKTDDADDVERWLDGEDDADNEAAGGERDMSEDGDGALPDDNISQYAEEGSDGDAD